MGASGFRTVTALRKLKVTDEADAYEDAVEVYFDPPEDCTRDCECSFFALTTTKNGGEPVVACIDCGRLAR